MISGTRDTHRSLGRWVIIILIAAAAAMIGIRTCSVRHRAGDARREPSRTAGRFDGARDDSSGERTSAGAGTGVAPAAREHAVLAWNEIRIDGSEGAGVVIVGGIHNNAGRNGEVHIAGRVDVYGRVTSAGTIAIGSADGSVPSTGSENASAVVRGSVAGDAVFVHEPGEVRDFLDLHEWAEGVDLTGDGDLDDLNVGKTPALIAASRRIVCEGEELSDGGTGRRIADGTRSVEVGAALPAPVACAVPDFGAYFETASGGSSYPPEGDHVVTDIPGDGDAHYFASAPAFLAWINAQSQTDVPCWRCAGDGAIDPESSTACPDCDGGGRVPAVEITGVFYIDDETLDLGAIETNLVVHGTIVVAEGNPVEWPRRTVESPGLPPVTIDHFPEKGSLVIGGPSRMHFTQTFRSDRDGGPYVSRRRAIHGGDDQQNIGAAVPEEGHALEGLPAIAAASRVVIAPRGAGFARHRADVGDEAVSVLHGAVFAGDEIRLGGRGGWKGDAVVFRETETRQEDDILDEAVFRIDLNDDGDTFDRLRLADVSGCPVIRVGKGRYHVDINGDGVLDDVVVGEDYGAFFLGNGFAFPTLVYIEGTLTADAVHVGGQCAVLFD